MINSRRADNRGHWPKGKSRNSVPPDWAKTRRQLAKFFPSIGYHSRFADLTRRDVADKVGVSESTIRRWLSGPMVPAPQHYKRLMKAISRVLK